MTARKTTCRHCGDVTLGMPLDAFDRYQVPPDWIDGDLVRCGSSQDQALNRTLGPNSLGFWFYPEEGQP